MLRRSGDGPSLVLGMLEAMLRLHPVESSSVAMIGYDDESSTLFMRFRDSGGSYLYEGVDQATLDALLEADSIGSFINRVIKPRYKMRKLKAS
jgi:hypothetical protein